MLKKQQKSMQKKLFSLKHSVIATYVMPLKQQKSLCLIPRYAKLQMRPYETSCFAEHLYT